jgi:hypothetical protein
VQCLYKDTVDAKTFATKRMVEILETMG